MKASKVTNIYSELKFNDSIQILVKIRDKK